MRTVDNSNNIINLAYPVAECNVALRYAITLHKAGIINRKSRVSGDAKGSAGHMLFINTTAFSRLPLRSIRKFGSTAERSNPWFSTALMAAASLLEASVTYI